MRRVVTASPELLDHQILPDGDWSTWLLLGGRGAGKTLAGARWATDLVQNAPLRIALVGPTLHDVREVMVEGPSGILALWRGWEEPVWQASRRRLLFPNGAVAHAFSAEDPDSLRGPQFHAAWADELCAWRRPEEVLSTLRMGLRLGDRPRLTVTTTPRPIAALRRLLAEPALEKAVAPTAANEANLAPGFLAHLRSLYGGTRLEAQELEGVIVESDGALFRIEDLRRARGGRPARLDKVVVAVDPPATAHGDACGIVVVGRLENRAYVLADATVRGRSPGAWAAHVAATVARHGAQAVIAESNQGGEMVRALLAQAGCSVPIRLAWAGRAKRARAEPVAALYEQGRVIHCGDLSALEEEMMALGEGGASPDRADALVWAVTHLLVETRDAWRPRVRTF
jgi:phage terminase large subunit-like protein